MERPEVTKKNKYWIDRHRYYELKHFCLQYPLWKRRLNHLREDTSLGGDYFDRIAKTGKPAVFDSRPVEVATLQYLLYKGHVDMVERIARKLDPVIGDYILKGVTEGRPYEYLRTNYNIPCNRFDYYDLYRKFFYYLSKERQ